MVGNDTQRREALPVAVRDLALRLGVGPASDRPTIRLTQRGRIRRSLDADRWMAFTATQTMETRDCAFDWRARAGPFGLVTARDALIDGEGCFDVTALGLIAPVRAPRTAALVRGELMRYLAQLASPRSSGNRSTGSISDPPHRR